MNKERDLEVPLIEKKDRYGGQAGSSPFSQFLSSASPAHKYQVNYSTAKYLSFLDMIPYIKKINQASAPTKVDDLPLPYHNFNIEAKVMMLDAEWNKEKEKPNPNLVMALFRTYKHAFFSSGIIMLFTFVGRLLSTLMLGKIIDVITRKDLGLVFDADVLVARTVLFAIIFFVTNIINTHFWNHNIILAARVRLTITGLVYKKLQTIALSSLQEMNIGKVVNLLASDLNDIDTGFMHLWPVILSPFLILLTAYFLWEFFGFYTVVSISGLIGSIFLSQYVSKLTQAPRVAKNAVTDERIKLTNEIVDCIRLLKMYSWEKAFKGIVEALRQKEFLALLRLNKVEILGRIVADMSVGVCAFLMFAFYTITGGLLTPEKVYTSLMLLNFARLWCIMFPHQGRVFIVNAKVMKKRVEDILMIPDVVSNEEAENMASRRNSGYGVLLSQNKIQLYEKEDTSDIKSIKLRDFTAYWSKKTEKPCLQNLNISIAPGQITTVIGKIGSGKTSFLLSLLREIPLTTGQLFCEGKIAYVEQEPIIFSQTVKENILFGQEFDATLYQKVVRACNLHIDFKQLTDGENTLVGERGVTLSGGQKARVSLARALYSRSDIYLLDDPLSAVDSKVARHLWNYVIKSELLKDKIVILVTHHLTYAKEADRVIAFDDGRIEAEGTFKDLQTMNIDLLNIFTHENEDYDAEEEEKRKTTRRSTVEVQAKEPAKEEKTKKFQETTTLVSYKTYRDYLKATGNFRMWYTVVGLFVAGQIISILNTRFTGYWAYDQQTYFVENDNSLEGFHNTWYLFCGFALVVAQFGLNYYKSVYLFTFAINNNSLLHNEILTKITRAAVSFFDKTPIGTILNRFSSDLGILDKSVWFSASFLIESFLQILFGLGTICTINFLVIVPSAIVMYLLVKVRDIFQKTSLESKRLDLTTKSPIYSQISATINGLLVIRVFQQGGRFIQNFMQTVYNNSRCFIFQQRVQRLFGMIQDMLAYVLTVCGIFLYIHVAQTSDIDPGLFGLAIVLILDICNRSAPFIRQTLEMDLQMQSAQRVLEYLQLPEEAPEHKYGMDEHVQRQFSNQWPHRGEIVFNNVHMKYDQTLDYVLKGLNFVVKPGMKVGCVGRTGAGKSSLIQVLFRMVEIDDGSEETGGYIKIDGVDIKEVGLEMLRKNLSIIPQTAAIFTGNIRRNLDPFGQFSDSQIWRALEEVKLKSYVERLEKKLDTDMTVSSTIFSAGQKQLICLARAMLRKSKIVVLDEATANVDIETDNFIQEKIDEIFADSTVFTVAHRLTTIAHYDKILVLDKGQVAEYESPYLLLASNTGDKRITNTDGIFAKMVISAGESMSRRIFDIASKKYFESNPHH